MGKRMVVQLKVFLAFSIRMKLTHFILVPLLAAGKCIRKEPFAKPSKISDFIPLNGEFSIAVGSRLAPVPPHRSPHAR